MCLVWCIYDYYSIHLDYTTKLQIILYCSKEKMVITLIHVSSRDMKRSKSKKSPDNGSLAKKILSINEDNENDDKKHSVSSAQTCVTSSKTDLSPLIHDLSVKQATVESLDSKPKSNTRKTLEVRFMELFNWC